MFTNVQKSNESGTFPQLYVDLPYELTNYSQFVSPTLQEVMTELCHIVKKVRV